MFNTDVAIKLSHMKMYTNFYSTVFCYILCAKCFQSCCPQAKRSEMTCHEVPKLSDGVPYMVHLIYLLNTPGVTFYISDLSCLSRNSYIYHIR